MPGKVEQEAVTGFCIGDKPAQPVNDVLFRGTLVHNHTDVIDVKGEIFEEDIPDVGDIVDASVEIRSRDAVFVDTDEKGTLSYGIHLVCLVYLVFVQDSLPRDL